jgi:hypothetical protein
LAEMSRDDNNDVTHLVPCSCLGRPQGHTTPALSGRP